jgi:hypothetical protein
VIVPVGLNPPASVAVSCTDPPIVTPGDALVESDGPVSGDVNRMSTSARNQPQLQAEGESVKSPRMLAAEVERNRRGPPPERKVAGSIPAGRTGTRAGSALLTLVELPTTGVATDAATAVGSGAPGPR